MHIKNNCKNIYIFWYYVLHSINIYLYLCNVMLHVLNSSEFKTVVNKLKNHENYSKH
jgi:hypothetical protein